MEVTAEELGRVSFHAADRARTYAYWP